MSDGDRKTGTKLLSSPIMWSEEFSESSVEFSQHC